MVPSFGFSILNCNYYFCICGEDYEYDEIELILIAFQFAKETFALDMQGFFLKTSLRSASWLMVKGDTFFSFDCKFFHCNSNSLVVGDLSHMYNT